MWVNQSGEIRGGVRMGGRDPSAGHQGSGDSGTRTLPQALPAAGPTLVPASPPHPQVFQCPVPF